MTLTLAISWAVAAIVVAFLPYKQQFRPGALLLILAPPIIVLLVIDYGLFAGLLAVAAFVSMFRHPLRFLYGKLRGDKKATT